MPLIKSIGIIRFRSRDSASLAE